MSDFETVMRGLLYPAHEVKRKEPEHPEKGSKRYLLLDDAGEPILDDAGSYESMALRMDAASIILAWAEDDDLDDGETTADRLLAMMVGVADEQQDGELDEDEHGVLDIVREAAWDYLEMLGVDEGDISLLLDDWDEAAAERIRDAIAAAMPDGDEGDGINSFVFGEDDQASVFDAAYKMKTVVRAGKKMRLKKRVSGRVRLSAKQKMAMRKARRKAHSPAAKMKRMKSMRKRQKMGVK
ncbi:MAG: hypothetical protein K9L88_11275 [Chromatiaceae bacterium]|nr:hypothetical protein [Chromatiaceae bacterium]